MAVEPRSQIEAEGRQRREQIALPRLAFALARATPHALLVAASLAALCGCAKTAAQKAEADLASVRKEADAKTLLERGKGFAAVGDHTRAEEYLASAIDAGADPRDVLPLLFDVCVRTGRYRSAIQHGENHLRKFPHDIETRVMVGALYTAISEGKPARMHLEQVVGKLDPNATYDDAATPAAPLPSPSAPPAPPAKDPSGTRTVSPRLRAQAHYLLALVSRDMDNDVLEADRHFREYLRLEPSGPHADEAKASLLSRVPTGTSKDDAKDASGPSSTTNSKDNKSEEKKP